MKILNLNICVSIIRFFHLKTIENIEGEEKQQFIELIVII